MKILLDTIDSTQAFASELLRVHQVSHGTLVMARYQSRGRGRGAHSWEGESGKNFYGSLVLRHVWNATPEPFVLSQVTALAVRDLIAAQTRLQVHIKWPNDVICAGKKVAGILISNQWKGSSWESSILGIGININQVLFSAATPDAVSLATLTGKSMQVQEIIHGLMDGMERYYDLLHRGESGQLASGYFNHLHGARVPVLMQEAGQTGSFRGQVDRVEPDGKIWIRTGSQVLKEYDMDQLKFPLS